jgi:hypothetical protein
MQEVKGGVLRSRLAFVEEHGGAQAVERVLGALPPDDQAKLKALTAVGWYPFEVGKRLDDAIMKVLGAGRADPRHSAFS